MKRYNVTGICFIPMQAEIEIEAESPEEARRLAMVEWNANKDNLLVHNSQSEGEAFDWDPTAEEIK